MSNSEKFDNALAQYLSGNVPKTSLQVAEKLLHNADAQQRQYANVENARQTKRSLNIHARPYTPTPERTWGEAFSDNFHKAVEGTGQTATNLIQLGIGATEFGLAVATGNGDEVANKLSKGIDNVTGFANSMTGGIIPKSDLNAPFRETDYENTGRSQFMQDVSNNAKMFSEMLSINAQERSNKHSEAMSDTYKRKAQEFEQAYESQKTDSALGNIFTRLKLAMEYDEVAGGMVAGSASSVALGGMLAKLGGADKALKTMAVLEGTSGYQQVKQEAIEAGIDFDNLQDPRAREAQQKAFNAGILTAGITIAGSTLAKRMGATDLDIGNTVAGTVSQSAKAGIVDSVLRSAMGVGTDLAEEAGIAIANRTQANLAIGKDTFENVDKEVADSLIATGGLKVATSGLPTAVNMVSGMVKGISDIATGAGELVKNNLKPSATIEEMSDHKSDKYAPDKAMDTLIAEYSKAPDENKQEYLDKINKLHEDTRKVLATYHFGLQKISDPDKVQAIQERIEYLQPIFEQLENKVVTFQDTLNQEDEGFDVADIIAQKTQLATVQPTAVQSTDWNSQTAQEHSPTSTGVVAPNAVIKMGKYQFSNNKQTNSDDVGRGSGDHLDIHLTGNLKGSNPTEYLDRFIVADGSHQGKDLKTLLSSGAYKPSSKQVFGASRKANGKSYSHDGIDFDSHIGGGVIINPKYQIKDVTAHHNPNGYGHYVKVHFADGVSIGLGHMGKTNVDAFMQAYKPNGTKATGNNAPTSVSTSNLNISWQGRNVHRNLKDKADYDDIMYSTYSKYGYSLPEMQILKSQLAQESNLTNITSNNFAGASGIAQFIEGTAKKYGVNRHDVASSIDGQARYMKDLLNRYNGDWAKALAAYNTGEGNVDKHWGKDGRGQGGGVMTMAWNRGNGETLKYVENILAHADKMTIKGQGGAINAPVSTSTSTPDTTATKDDTLLKPTITLDDVKSESEGIIQEQSENVSQSVENAKSTQPTQSVEEQQLSQDTVAKITRRYSKIVNVEQVENHINEITQLEQAGVIDTDTADGLRQIAEFKRVHLSKDLGMVSRDIEYGRKGNTPQESMLGIRNYEHIFNTAIAKGKADDNTANALEHLHRFTRSHVSKAQAIEEALELGASSKNPITIAPIDGVWQVIDLTKYTDEQLKHSGKFTVTGENRATTAIANEAEMIANFANAYTPLVSNLLGKSGLDNSNYAPKTQENEVANPVLTNTQKPVQETLKTSQKNNSDNNPVNDKVNVNASPVTPTQPQAQPQLQTQQVKQASGLPSVDKADQVPSNGMLVGRDGFTSMFNLVGAKNPINVGDKGWLGNPYNVAPKTGGKGDTFKKDTHQEAMDSYVELFKNNSTKIPNFIEGLIKEKGKQVYKNTKQKEYAEADFVSKVLKDLPDDKAEALEYISRIEGYDTETGKVAISEPIKKSFRFADVKKGKEKEKISQETAEQHEPVKEVRKSTPTQTKQESQEVYESPSETDIDLASELEYDRVNQLLQEASEQGMDLSNGWEYVDNANSIQPIQGDLADWSDASTNTTIPNSMVEQAKETLSQENETDVEEETFENEMDNLIEYSEADDKVTDGKLSLFHNRTKKIREAELAKPITQQNYVISGIKQGNKRNLNKSFNLSEQLEEMYYENVKATKGETPDIYMAQLGHYLNFEKRFAQSLFESFEPKGDKYRFEDMKNFLNMGSSSEPVFDDNLLSAMALTVYDFLNIDGNKFYNTPEELKRLLNLDETQEVPSEMYEIYGRIGQPLSFLAVKLGKQISKNLEFKQYDDVPADTLARLETSLGFWVISAMQMQGLVHFTDMPSTEHRDNILKAGGQEFNANEKGKITFVSMADPSVEKPIAHKEVQKIQSKSHGTNQFLQKLYGIDSLQRLPLLEKPTKANLKISKSNSKVSGKQAESILAMSQAPIKLNKSMFNVLDKMDKDFVLELIGGKVSDDYIEGLHFTKREGALAKAEGIAKSLENALMWKNSLGDLNTPFYDTASVKVNNRMHYDSNVFNFQSDKVHRALGEYENFENEIDLTDIQIFSESKPTQHTLFIRAVFENAEGTKGFFENALKNTPYTSGYTVDKLPSDVFMPIAMDYLHSDKVQFAVKAMNNILNGKGTDKDKQIIQTIIKEWDMGASSLRALVEVTNYFNALESGNKFVTSLGLGSDGVNNGTAIASTYMGIDSTQSLDQVGIFKEDSKFETYFETRADRKVKDYYEGLEEFIFEALDSVNADFEVELKQARANKDKTKIYLLQTNLKNLNAFRKLVSFSRSDLKAILIPFGYGASIPRLIDASFDKFVGDTYNKFEKLHHKYNEATAEVLGTQLSVLLDKDMTLPKEGLLETYFEEADLEDLKKSYKYSVGKAIEKAIQNYASEYIKGRNLLIGSHSATSELYIKSREALLQQAEEAHAQSVREQYKHLPANVVDSIVKFNTLSQKEIYEQVDKPLKIMYPKLHSVYSHDETHANSIELFEQKRKLENNNESVQAVNNVIDLDGNTVKLYRKLPVLKFTPVSTGVRPYSQTVQGTDSFISSKASIADGVVSINVHDANIAGLKHYIQMSVAQNKAFVDGVLNYHQGYHSVSTMLRSLKGFMNLSIDEESKEAILQDFANELFKTTKNRKDYSLDEIAEKVWITVAQAMNGDIRKAELFSNLKSVQQYAGEGGQYYLTDADKTKAKEIKAQLENDKKKLLNQVEALFKSNITSPAPIEEQARVLQGNPVAKVKKADVPKQGAGDWAKAIFDSWGNEAFHPVLGRVGLSHNAVNNSMNHKQLKFKWASFPAIKSVIEEGVLIYVGSHKDKHGNLIKDYYVSAPIKTDNSDDVVTVLIKQNTQTKQMYVHSVTSKNRLMTPKEETVLTDSVGQLETSSTDNQQISSEKATSTDIHNILHKAVTYKGEEVKTESKKPKLPSKNQYTAKDQEKSDKANKFIGYGLKDSSTEKYRQVWGLFANVGDYSKDDKVFVSVNGNTNGRVSIHDAKFKNELELATDAGATIISDNTEHRNRPYNIGERELAEYLISKGYQETDGNGVWVKNSLPTDTKSFKVEDIEKAVTKRQVSSEQKELFNGLIEVVKTKYPNLTLSFEKIDTKGYYEKGKIVLNKSLWDKLSEEKNHEQQVALINHELMHAVTLDAIVSYPEHKAVKDLQDMRDQLAQKWEAIKGKDPELDGYLTHVFEVEDASELVAYGTENPKVRDFIAKHLDVKALGLRANGGKYKGAFQAFTEAVFALIHKMLGKGKHIPYRVFMESIEAVMAIDTLPSNSKANSKEISISQIRYSKEGIRQEAEKSVNALSISELLKTLDSGNISENFNNHLDTLNETFTNLFYNQTNKNLVNEKLGKLKYIKAYGFMQSQKEAYTHNAIYEVLDLFMSNQAGSIPASQMNKLYETVKQAYPSGKALFKDYDNVDTDTRKLYDKMYAYVFKPKDTVNATARFMAMALTNEQFGRLLNQTKTKEIKENKTWFDKVMGIFSKIVGAISDKIYKTNSQNDLKKIAGYVNALARLETQARNEKADKLQIMWEKGINVTSKLNSPIVHNTKKAVKFVKDRNVPIISNLAGSVYGFANSGNEAISNLVGMADIAKNNELGKAMNDLVQEVTHHGNSGQLLDKLMRMTQHIGQVRQRVKDGNIKSLKNSFNEPLTKEQSYAITRAMVKTDLSGLLENGFKPKEVFAMLNKSKRQIKVVNLLKELRPLIKSNEQFNDMVHQSLILGKYMATGVTSAHLIKNSEGIAKSYGSDWQTDTLDKDIHKIVDSLVSLYALDFVDASELSIVEELVKTKEKGLTTILNNHRELNKRSKEEFVGNPLNYQKGYIPQITNPYVSVIFAEASEVKNYLAKGYEVMYELAQDKHDKTHKRVLMVHPNHNPNNYVSGALDMTDSHTKGTIIYDSEENSKEISRVATSLANARRQRSKIPVGSFQPDSSEHSMVVTYATDGSIMNYKYEMADKSRDEVLERNLDAIELLSTLSGNLAFRPLIREQQKNVAEAMILDARNFASNPKAFTFLDFKSNDPKIVTMVRMLPHETRVKLVQQYGNKPIPVRTSTFNVLFGFKAFSLVNSFDKLDNGYKLNIAEKVFLELATRTLGRNARGYILQAEKIVQELVAQIKDMIVIRSGGVLLGNIFSNMQLLMVQGINPIRVLSDTTFAWRNGRAYAKDSNRLYEIEALLTMTRNNGELGKLKRERAMLIQKLEKNPMHDYMQAGLQSTIVEDLALDVSEGYKSSLEKKIEDYTDRIPQHFKNLFNIATIGKGTQLHNLMSEATQFSDFVAKYTLAKYRYEKLQEANPNAVKEKLFDKAIYEAQENFINYDIPTHYLIDYANRMGFMMFTKFFLRFQLILAKLLKEKPAQMIGMHLLAEGLGTQGIIEPAWFNRFGNPFDESVFMGADAFSNIATVDAVF